MGGQGSGRNYPDTYRGNTYKGMSPERWLYEFKKLGHHPSIRTIYNWTNGRKPSKMYEVLIKKILSDNE